MPMKGLRRNNDSGSKKSWYLKQNDNEVIGRVIISTMTNNSSGPYKKTYNLEGC